ncbi:hypothetical protein [Sphingomonas sp.]|uniref:hypothetical protein n=1 Tax=Sphingomonas sp. TaxID=28214 RepID=UPI002ED83CDF
MTLVKLDKPALVLRTSDKDGRSYHTPTFQWPESGRVIAPDWDPSPRCGNGLHGLLWGEGGSGYLTFHPDSRWQVVEIDEYVQASSDKVKYPEGRVVFSGTQEEATRYIYERAPAGTCVVGVSLTGGYGSTLTGGNRSTLTGGYGSTLTGGDDSTLTGGNRSTLTGGNRSTLTGGNRSTLTGGDDSTLTGGYGSTLTGGYGSTLVFKHWSSAQQRYRRKLVEVGDTVDGALIEAGKAYRMTDGGVIVRV